MNAIVKINSRAGLTDAFSQIHAVNFQRTLTVRMIHLVNLTAGAVAVTVCFVPPGETAVAGTAILWDFSIPANDFIEFGEGFVLPSSWTIQAKAGANNSIMIWVCGGEE